MKREYLPRLAREHGITEEFCSAVKVLQLHPACINIYWAGKCAALQPLGPTHWASTENLCGLENEPFESLHIQESSTVDDFERLADLDFGLMVWRQNLKRSMSLAASCQVWKAPPGNGVAIPELVAALEWHSW